MKYQVVTAYHRQEYFDYYRRYQNPFYSMTFELEVARLKKFVDHHGYRTYLNLCYFFTRAAQGIEDFRYRWHDERIVLYEEIHPGLTVPAADGSFGYAHFRYLSDVHRFNAEAEEAIPSPDRAPDLAAAEHENFLFFTAIPGTVFSGFTHAWERPIDGAPRVAFGSLFERAGVLVVPVGIQVNHCFIDGRALADLVRRAQEAFDRPAGRPGSSGC
jgi:chloramphenicol O-acetyltransferase type A